ncbi:MAG: hypothetical protein DRH57_03325 [Candidatus Cloacimonadota bacterium]|nr:MAG: hypothetical protein DRH57_03325 [Candidatus Cloacimonadota bacterium]
MDSDIADYFISLVQIDSESKDEKRFAKKMEQELLKLGAEVKYDNANKKTGGNVGNLIAYLPGKIDKEPLLFCCHLDTVKPGKNIKPVIKDGRIYSSGDTILGADDKSGIAELIYAIRHLQRENISYLPIEVIFTISEEIGLLGAKNLDYSLIRAKKGYALDTHKLGAVTIQAPSQNSFDIKIIGKEAHAGAEPEKGISAIRIASESISKLNWGRLDDETTSNIGTIQGGIATNIIAKETTLTGELRSHNEDTLKRETDKIINTFIDTAKEFSINIDGKLFEPKVDYEVRKEYSALNVSEHNEIVQIGLKSAKKLGLPAKTIIGGGGSDANIIHNNGIDMVILGTGMRNVHTVEENIPIDDLIMGTKWIIEIIKEYSK